jgi:hypothetical protein
MGPSKSSLTEGSHAIPSYDAEDRDYMIRTIAFEPPAESDEGKAAVAYVILNCGLFAPYSEKVGRQPRGRPDDCPG